MPGVEVQVTLPEASSGPHSFAASAGSDTPSDKGTSAEAARSSSLRRLTPTLASMTPCRKQLILMAYPQCCFDSNAGQPVKQVWVRWSCDSPSISKNTMH